MEKADLSTVTLCAATSVNVVATIEALRQSAERAIFAQCILFTDADVDEHPPGMTIVRTARMRSARDYSAFVLRDLAAHITTPHCLIVQWDGFVLDPAAWEAGFLEFDYVGAPWPQFGEGQDVGNGGFSLRSRRLLEACRDPEFVSGHPEDVAICRINRTLLEAKGLNFADRATASRFAFERSDPEGPTFGFHGVFNMAPVMGVDRFWEIYRTLDDRATAFTDYRRLMRQLGDGKRAWSRRLRLTADRLRR